MMCIADFPRIVRALRPTLIAVMLGALILPSLSGCALVAQAMSAASTLEVVPPKYKGLASQSVAVVVWAEETGIRIDWPRIQLDAASMITSKIQGAQKEYKSKELELTRFPVSVSKIVMMQEDHPEWASMGMEEIAVKLGVTRVIYVEIRGFQTRAETSVDLFRGSISGSASVLEVADGKARVAFTDDNIRISYPKIAPEEGLPNLGDFPVYHGTLEAFSTEVAKLFAPHGNDPDADYTSSESDAK